MYIYYLMIGVFFHLRRNILLRAKKSFSYKNLIAILLYNFILLTFKFSIVLYITYIYYKCFYKIFCLILKYTHLIETEKYFCYY